VLKVVEERGHRPTDFEAIRVRLASPEMIMSWSHGEVTKPETINYRTQKPEKDGLFCERVFGPVKDYECNCGKYKRIRFRGVVCERCGVEVTLSKVRRERMGHVKLSVPVAHIWMYKAQPSRIGLLLDMSVREVERVLYYESYVVIDPGDSPLKVGDTPTEDEIQEFQEQYGGRIVAKIGAEGIKELLKRLDLDELSATLRSQIKHETSADRKRKILQRLRVVEAFRQSGNRPEWMILDVIPVIPPDLRPLVALEGGRFATSDLNDLYRRVITRNNRLKHLIEIKAPEIILRNEKRMLQEAVDALLDNSRRSRAIKGRGNRPLKSLSDALKGKQGRFRQNLLGKRVDYSGRSVIVVGPELELHQCGLPKNMALELFKPFVIKKLEEKGHAQTVKSAKRLLERETPEVWEILEEITRDHPVLLNRAPTLHRVGIQAFSPVLVEGKAIKIHPLVCYAFAADFDGDQMAVHVPLSFEAQLESAILMLSVNNILSPAHGRPLVSPTQDIVLGCYYLTKMKSGQPGEGKIFSGTDEVVRAYEAGGPLTVHTKIRVRLNGKVVDTTVGRVLFNEIVPEGIPFVNELLDNKRLTTLVADVHRQFGGHATARFLDKLKEFGFGFATRSGLTVGIDDMIVPPEKQQKIVEAEEEVARIWKSYRKGVISDGERYNMIIDVWTHTTTEVGEVMFRKLEEDREGFNPFFMMADSGARGSKEQVRQLAGMRGLMAKPQKKITGQVGEIIESPITANFREGLTVLEYFISTHGARKGLADTALKTAEAGYLTRRMVDVAQDVIITEEDCGTILGQEVSALKEGEEVIESLRDRILGRVLLEDVRNPITRKMLARAGEEVDEDTAQQIEDLGIETVKIRSVLTCEARRGLCVKCYGRNLATGCLVDLGEAVGVIAAQSIGEPGTQLTLRTFHIGGTAARIAEQSKAVAKTDGVVKYEGVRSVRRETGDKVAVSRNARITITGDRSRVPLKFVVPYGATLRVDDGVRVKQGDIVFEWDPYSSVILSEYAGAVEFVDIVDDVTVREEMDEVTGLKQRVIVEHKGKTLHPQINIRSAKGRRLGNHSIPTGAYILVHDGETVSAGSLVAKIPRDIGKTRDITGGLPRVAELFEARKPKDRATVTDTDGRVRFGELTRGMRTLTVVGDTDEEGEYQIPHGRHLVVHDGDHVRAGDRLSEGPVNPHDILRIKGANAVQEYLVNEIQEVYRLQGVRINDKHIGVIVRQMLQKVKIEDPGDTSFIEGEQVDKTMLREENERVMAEGGRPATFEPLLLGITKAALSTDSFISAASFQETTKVLTEAAIQGKTDRLLGLKENVIMGSLVPAGTGLREYRRIEIELEEEPPSVKEETDERKVAG